MRPWCCCMTFVEMSLGCWQSFVAEILAFGTEMSLDYAEIPFVETVVVEITLDSSEVSSEVLEPDVVVVEVNYLEASVDQPET